MAEPAQRRTADDGGKFYEHPTRVDGTGAPRRYISVTTALGVIAKPALLHWATKLSARRAMENLPKLIAGARIADECGRTYARTDPPRCGVCVRCVQRWVEIFHIGEKERRAREGSAVHDVIEWWSMTGEIRYKPSEHMFELDGVTRQVTWEQIEPYIQRFEQWVADYGITPESFLVCEATVWHHGDGWGGTTDGILRICPVTAKAARLCARIHAANGRTGAALDEPVDVVLDNKSREGDQTKREPTKKAFYPEYALQSGGAYRHAQTMTAKLSAFEVDMPKTDGAVILQLRPDGYSFEPVSAGMREYRAFLAALDLFRWQSEHGDASVQVGTFPVPAGWKWPPGGPTDAAMMAGPPTFERATTPDGKLCGCAACDDPNDPGCLFGGKACRPPGPHTREVTRDGDPVPPAEAPPAPVKATKRAAAPRKRAGAAKKAAATAADTPGRPSAATRAGAENGGIMASLHGKMATPGATLADDDIPY
jgi:hypothetical protein